jgi:hypothetical protein
MKRLPFLYLFLCSFSLVVSSCTSNPGEKSSIGLIKSVSKPTLAIAPVIDSTSGDLSWSLSEELTSLFHQQIEMSHSFLLPSLENAENDLSFSQNPFGKDLSWVKKSFPTYQFVVFLELIEHEKRATDSNAHFDLGPSNLEMRLRLRILDLRGEKPALLLQELLTNSYFIPQALCDIDYEKISWGAKEYSATPYYQAHLQLAQETAKRILAYIQP